MAYHVFVPQAGGLGPVYSRFETREREVWLTIDDGPDPVDTPQLLEVLARHGARATFFTIGKLVEAHPELMRAILADGHEVAHHTHTHPLPTFWAAGPGRTDRELDRSVENFAAFGVAPRWFLAPAGIKALWLHPALAQRGLACVAWSGRGLERWADRPEPVVARLLKGVRPGAVLLVHQGRRVPAAVRVAAIDQLLAQLAQRGYRTIIPRPEQLRA
ncbi:MAG TPA: polysaccharide deacetylase family protein [Candidatus Synoicihabitans sp.]|nr:polysaccharide deacetylase family protein [Candidatus Synoicihabitans sp.]